MFQCIVRGFVKHEVAAFLLGALVVAIPISLHGQGGTIVGTVTHEDSGEPLSAVQLSVQGLQIGGVSGADGSFAISNVPAGTHALLGQRLGFQVLREEGVTVTEGATTTLQLTMSPTVLALQGIVATGLVDPVEGVRSPIAVARVTREMMPVTASGSAVENLQGRVAGLRMARPSGQPGSEVQIMLRTPTSIRTRPNPGTGGGSIGSGFPLIVVDGVVLGGAGTPTTAELEAMDIESMEVIRGAAAASMYGSRAAAGVIAITTARGQGLPLGQTRLTARSELGVTQALRGGRALSDHHFYLMDPTNSFYVDAQGNQVDRNSRVAPHPTQAFLDKPYPDPIYDNLSAITQPGGFRSNNVGIAGNAASTNFAISLNNYHEQGALANNDGYSRNSFRMNLDHRFIEALSLGTSLYHSRDNRDEMQGNPFNDALTAPRDVDFTRKGPDGQYLQQPDPNIFIQNPLWTQATRDNTRWTNRTLASGTLTWNPYSWLGASGTVGYDRMDRVIRQYVPKGTPANVGSEGELDGSLSIANQISDTWNAEAQVSLRRDFGLLNARTTFRSLLEYDSDQAGTRSGSGFLVHGVPQLSNIRPEDRNATTTESERRALGYLWDTAFDYDAKYIVSVLVRRDGSSLFGPDNRWHNYYRVAGAWRLSEEPWFDIRNVNELKVSFARGTAGGRPGQTWQYETWSLTGGIPTKGTLGNRSLRPEHTVENELSLNLVLYDRVGVVLTHARQQTSDQLIDAPQSIITGYVDQFVNAGTISGHSTELELEAQLIQRANVGWNSMLVADYSYAKITDWPLPCRTNIAWRKFCPGEPVYAHFSLYIVKNTHERGGLAGELAPHHGGKLLPYIDQFMFNDEGWVVWVGEGNHYTEGLDKNLWGTTTTIEGIEYHWGVPFHEADEMGNPFRQAGSTSNPYNLGWVNNFRLGSNLTLHAHLHTSWGAQAHHRYNTALIRNGIAYVLDADGKPDGLKKPRSYYNIATQGNTNYYVEGANYLKLRTASLTYRLSSDQLARFRLGGTGIRDLTLGLVGRNLLTVTNFSGFEPENALNLATGVAASTLTYPPTRNLTAEISVTF